MRKWNYLLVLAAAAGGFLVSVSPVPGQGGARNAKGKDAPKAGPVKRLRDGKPDIQGFWETRNFFSAFDLDGHPWTFGTYDPLVD